MKKIGLVGGIGPESTAKYLMKLYKNILLSDNFWSRKLSYQGAFYWMQEEGARKRT